MQGEHDGKNGQEPWEDRDEFRRFDRQPESRRASTDA